MHAQPAGSRHTSRHTAEEAGHHTMKIRLGLISWATGALVLVAVTACSDESAEQWSPAEWMLLLVSSGCSAIDLGE